MIRDNRLPEEKSTVQEFLLPSAGARRIVKSATTFPAEPSHAEPMELRDVCLPVLEATGMQEEVREYLQRYSDVILKHHPCGSFTLWGAPWDVLHQSGAPQFSVQEVAEAQREAHRMVQLLGRFLTSRQTHGVFVLKSGGEVWECLIKTAYHHRVIRALEKMLVEH